MENLKQRLKKHMEYLCLECGPRQVGSLGERKASEYIEKEFNKIGYKTVREEYPVTGWECSEFSLWNVTKNRAVPGACAEFFSNSVTAEDKLLFIKGQDLKRLDKLDLKELFILAIATSIDALAVGITFAFLKYPVVKAVTVIGVVTFIISMAGVYIGNFFGSRFKKKAEIAGGIILVGIGIKILLEHLGIF